MSKIEIVVTLLGFLKALGVLFQSLTAAFNCYNLQYLLATVLSLYNVGASFFLTMTRKPTRLTYINNATINRHDMLHPSRKEFRNRS